MKTLIRKTISGSEYWDTDSKRTLFVPKGKKPDFEVTDNPESMIGEEQEETPSGSVSETYTNLEKMTVAQLKEYAGDKGIEIPNDVSKKYDIVSFLVDALDQ